MPNGDSMILLQSDVRLLPEFSNNQGSPFGFDLAARLTLWHLGVTYASTRPL